MAGKKYDIGALKGTTGGNRHEDRFSTNKNTFEATTLDAKNALTVIYMLQSPEDSVVIKAVASLEVFARKSPENLMLLSSLGIFQYLFPLVRHNDRVVKRFSQKLMGMLCSLEEFRELVLSVDDILKIFVDILAQESDEVMQEYAALTLAELSSECHAASELLKVENCIETLFLRIESVDPDVEKNCLDIMNHLLDDINGIDFFVKNQVFDVKILLELTSSSYPVIQNLALDVLKQLTAGSRVPNVLFAFRDVLGIETVLNILENEDWGDLHENASDLLINVTENPNICDYILQSGNLLRLINLLDNASDKSVVLKFIEILAKMTQTFKGRKALYVAEMDKRFSKYLSERNEKIQEYSCYAIANLAQYLPCLINILEENSIGNMLDFLIDQTKTHCLRNMAAYALSILCNEDRRASEAFLRNEKWEKLFPILSGTFDAPVELRQNLIQIFIGISLDEKLRFRLITEEFFFVLVDCLDVNFPDGNNTTEEDQSYHVDVLECLSHFLVEQEARVIFNTVEGGKKLIDCLRSRFASVRNWAGHLVVLMSQSEDFVNFFIRNKGLEWMLKERNKMCAMPNWHSAIQAIFRENLSAKFAYVGRLDLQDLTKDGFFVYSNPRFQFVLLEDFFTAKCNPLDPVYFVNFSNQNLYPSVSKTSSTVSDHEDTDTAASVSQKESKPSRTPNQKSTKEAEKNLVEEHVWDGMANSHLTVCSMKSVSQEVEKMDDFFVDTKDTFLMEYVTRLKRKMEREELLALGSVNWWCMHPQLITERARIIGEFVASEMTGPNPDPACNSQYKIMHLNEMKYHLGTNIIPLGFIRMGDYLERALLFKVLADRIGFPCALVRGTQGKAWIEIAIPVINVEDVTNESSSEMLNPPSWSDEMQFDVEGETESGTVNESNVRTCWEQEETFFFPKIRMECFKSFPQYFLKTNAVVDLVEVPGRILKINSLEAKNYCGYFNV